MQTNSKQQQLRFQGVLNTPNLWHKDNVFSFLQFIVPNSGKAFNKVITKNLRLGKLVEQFVLHELEQDASIKLLSENYQVQDNKLTVGELDCLFVQDEQPIHLEIVYKFYLYDPAIGNTFLEHWIGPNRRDSLILKLNKLKEKQLPLLYHPLTQNHLNSLGYTSEDFKQNVCFKAQLFLPFNSSGINLEALNPECVEGFYLKPEELTHFKDCKFFIPNKLGWLMDIPIQIDWLSFSNFKLKLQTFLDEQSAPLVWIKKSNGTTLKCFVVWW